MHHTDFYYVEGKRPLERPSHRWEDNIKMDLRDIGMDGANWTRLAQDRVRWRAFQPFNSDSNLEGTRFRY
jgi:hypothetical protein